MSIRNSDYPVYDRMIMSVAFGTWIGLLRNTGTKCGMVKNCIDVPKTIFRLLVWITISISIFITVSHKRNVKPKRFHASQIHKLGRQPKSWIVANFFFKTLRFKRLISFVSSSCFVFAAMHIYMCTSFLLKSNKQV